MALPARSPKQCRYFIILFALCQHLFYSFFDIRLPFLSLLHTTPGVFVAGSISTTRYCMSLLFSFSPYYIQSVRFTVLSKSPPCSIGAQRIQVARLQHTPTPLRGAYKKQPQLSLRPQFRIPNYSCARRALCIPETIHRFSFAYFSFSEKKCMRSPRGRSFFFSKKKDPKRNCFTVWWVELYEITPVEPQTSRLRFSFPC